MNQYKITMYKTDTGKVPFILWLESIKDPTIKRRIRLRVDRMIDGNFGDTKISEKIYMNCGYSLVQAIEYITQLKTIF